MYFMEKQESIDARKWQMSLDLRVASQHCYYYHYNYE